jgi:hypothetical protein
MNKIDFTLTVPKNAPLDLPGKTSAAPCPKQFTASTITRLNAKASDQGGVCGWINQVWQWILSLFGASSSPTLETRSIPQPQPVGPIGGLPLPPPQGPIGPTTIDATELAERITRGNQIIDGLFRRPFIVNANGPRSAIMVVMKYNDQCKMQIGRAAEVRNAIPTTKNMLRQLLTEESSRHVSQPGAHRLSVIIYRFDKGLTYSFEDASSWFNFLNYESGGGGSRNEEFGETTLNQLLAFELEQPHLTQAANYLINQL